MVEALERLLARTLRIPPEPEPPAGSEGSLRVFRAAPGFLRYAQLKWLLRQGSLVLGFVVAARITAEIFGNAAWTGDDFVANVSRSSDVPPIVVVALLWAHEASTFLFLGGGLDALLIALFLLQIPVTFALVELDYRLRWYMVTDRSLRIREGIWHVREQTLTFSNIQNMAIRQGPLQRALGIADLEVRTAGGGSESRGKPGPQSDDNNLHTARFAGVGNAMEIRDTIRGRLERPPASAPTRRRASAVEAARALLEEARGFRTALETWRTEGQG